MSIFPSNPQVGDEYSGKRWNGTTWEVIGVNLSRDYALESSFTSHTSASTSVHGIPDTSTLATQANLASASAAATSYADTAISNLVDAAPEALNTLNELAAALGDDSNFATTVTNSLSTKQSASSAMVVVDNGSDSNFTRPTGVGAVYWIGSASPSNAAEYDMWWSG
jgi:hypothetical protein